MNKYMQRLALWLINRKLKKHENKALKVWSAESNRSLRRTVAVVDYIEDKEDYTRLRNLKYNIEGINGFWQGEFAPFGWTRFPKNKKHIETPPKFEPSESEMRRLEALPLSPEDQKWADLEDADFWQAIDEIPALDLKGTDQK